MVGEFDGFGLSLSDLIGDGADAVLADVRFEGLEFSGGEGDGGSGEEVAAGNRTCCHIEMIAPDGRE